MPRQFSLKTLLWLMACVACFLAGIASHREYVKRQRAKAMMEYRQQWVAPNLDDPPIFQAPE